MKKALLFIMILTLFIASASGTPRLKSADKIHPIKSYVSDSAGLGRYKPDSVRIMVTIGLAQVHDAWYFVDDAECDTIDDELVFCTTVGALDGDSTTGSYTITADFYYDSDSLYWPVKYYFEEITYSVDDIYLMCDTTRDTVVNYLTATPADSGVVERLIDSILDARSYSTLTLAQDSGVTERLIDSILDARGYSTLTLAQDSGVTERLIDSILNARGYSTYDPASDGVKLAAHGLDDDTSFTQLQTYVTDSMLDLAQLDSMFLDSAGLRATLADTLGLDDDTTSTEFQQAIIDLIAALNDISAEDIYKNIDTVHVDSSDIGAWWVNNLSGGSANVWKSVDTADVDSSDIGVWLVNNLSSGGQSFTDWIDSLLNYDIPSEYWGLDSAGKFGYYLMAANEYMGDSILGTADIEAIMTDSVNVARDDTKEDYQGTGGATIANIKYLMTDTINVARDDTKSDYQATSVTVSDKTGFTLAAHGLDSDTSFTQIQGLIKDMNDSLEAWDDNLSHLDADISSRSTLTLAEDSGITERLIDSILNARGYSTLTLAQDSGITERLIDSILNARSYSTLTLAEDSGITERLIDSILNSRGYSTLTLAQDSGVTERLIDSILDARGYSTLTLAQDSGVTERLIDSILTARGYATATAVSNIYSEVENLDGWNFATDLVLVDSAPIARSVWDNDIVAKINRYIFYSDSTGEVSEVIASCVPDSLFDTLTAIHTTAEGISASLPDSLFDTLTAIHTSVTGITASIPDSLFDTLTAVHTSIAGITASVPDSLFDTLTAIQTSIAGLDLGTGSGAYACSLYVYNETDTSAVQGVYARIMNDAQDATEAVGLTNSNGLVVLSLDAAQYKIWLYKAGVTASNPDSVTVADPSVTDTIFVSVFSPSAPASPDLCNIYGTVEDAAGNAVEGAVVICKLRGSNLKYIDSTLIIAPLTVTDTTDASGDFEIGLIPNASILDKDNEAGTTYWQIEIIGSDKESILNRRITVPDQANWRLIW